MASRAAHRSRRLAQSSAAGRDRNGPDPARADEFGYRVRLRIPKKQSSLSRSRGNPLIPSKPASWKPEIAGESRHSLQCPPEHHAGGRQRPASEEDGDAWLWRHRPDLRWSFPGGWSRRACGLSDRAPACDLDDLHRHATRCSIVLAYDELARILRDCIGQLVATGAWAAARMVDAMHGL